MDVDGKFNQQLLHDLLKEIATIRNSADGAAKYELKREFYKLFNPYEASLSIQQRQRAETNYMDKVLNSSNSAAEKKRSSMDIDDADSSSTIYPPIVQLSSVHPVYEPLDHTLVSPTILQIAFNLLRRYVYVQAEGSSQEDNLMLDDYATSSPSKLASTTSTSSGTVTQPTKTSRWSRMNSWLRSKLGLKKTDNSSSSSTPTKNKSSEFDSEPDLSSLPISLLFFSPPEAGGVRAVCERILTHLIYLIALSVETATRLSATNAISAEKLQEWARGFTTDFNFDKNPAIPEVLKKSIASTNLITVLCQLNATAVNRKLNTKSKATSTTASATVSNSSSTSSSSSSSSSSTSSSASTISREYTEWDLSLQQPLLAHILSRLSTLPCTSTVCQPVIQTYQIEVNTSSSSDRAARLAKAKRIRARIVKEMQEKIQKFAARHNIDITPKSVVDKQEEEKKQQQNGEGQDSHLSHECIVCRSDNSDDIMGLIGWSIPSRIFAHPIQTPPCLPKARRTRQSEEFTADVTEQPTAYLWKDQTSSSSSSSSTVKCNAPPFHSDASSMPIKFCGHSMHIGCRDSYIGSLIQRDLSFGDFEGKHSLDVMAGQFLCPLCKVPSNVLVPITQSIQLSSMLRANHHLDIHINDVNSWVQKTHEQIVSNTDETQDEFTRTMFWQVKPKFPDGTENTAIRKTASYTLNLGQHLYVVAHNIRTALSVEAHSKFLTYNVYATIATIRQAELAYRTSVHSIQQNMKNAQLKASSSSGHKYPRSILSLLHSRELDCIRQLIDSVFLHIIHYTYKHHTDAYDAWCHFRKASWDTLLKAFTGDASSAQLLATQDMTDILIKAVLTVPWQIDSVEMYRQVAVALNLTYQVAVAQALIHICHHTGVDNQHQASRSYRHEFQQALTRLLNHSSSSSSSSSNSSASNAMTDITNAPSSDDLSKLFQPVVSLLQRKNSSSSSTSSSSPAVVKSCCSLTDADDLYSLLLPFLRTAAILFKCLHLIPNKPVSQQFVSEKELNAHSMLHIEFHSLVQQLRLPSFEEVAASLTSSSSLTGTSFLETVLSGINDSSQSVQLSVNKESFPFLLSRISPLGFHPPSFVTLPQGFDELFQNLADKEWSTCLKCKNSPKKPALCLSCGELLCSGEDCCHSAGQGELSTHTKKCSPSGGAYLLIRECAIILINEGLAASHGSVYVDNHGETDIGLTRARPLFLSQDRLEEIRQAWIYSRIPTLVCRFRSGRYQNQARNAL